MRGLNKVILSGSVVRSIEYGKTGSGAEACTFYVQSDRPTNSGETLSVAVKVNVYVEGLVRICRSKLRKNIYVIVDGELMTREIVGLGEHIEVRCRDILFLPAVAPTVPTDHEP